MVYAREIDGETYRFGVSGLDEGTLILYDAETRSRWSQLVGEAVAGKLKGKRLEKLPSTMTTWARWRQLHPDTTVYVKRTIPYGAQFTDAAFARVGDAAPGPPRRDDLVIGVEGHVGAAAWLARRLAKEGRLEQGELEGAPIAVFLGGDLATARVFERRVRDRTLSFELQPDDRLRDAETGSLWDPVSGVAVAGPLVGEPLEPLISTWSVWYAWQKYRPDTTLHGEPAPAPSEPAA